MNPNDLIQKFHLALPHLRQWVEDTLAAHRKQSVPVNRMGYARLGQVFPEELLQRVRSVVVEGNPPFPALSRMGLPELARFEALPITGVTYRDTFFVRRAHQTESLYFHETVHVVQWDRLGVDRFLLAYGVGLMQFGYRDSPLEEMAYTLQDDFDQGRLAGDLVGRIHRETDAVWEGVKALL